MSDRRHARLPRKKEVRQKLKSIPNLQSTVQHIHNVVKAISLNSLIQHV